MNRLKTTVLLGGLIGLVLAFGYYSSASAIGLTQNEKERYPSTVLTITIEEEIRAGTVQFITRALRKAETEKVDFFIIQLNTPGGLLKATEEISRLLLDSKIKTAVFIHKNAGWAFSAGAYILLSAEIAASHPEATIGAAQPRALDLTETAKPDDKIIEASALWLKSIAQARGRNVEVAEKFVRENLVLSGNEARQAGAIDFTAASLNELLAQLGAENAIIIEEKPNAIENILSFFSIPYLVPLLLSIGALGLFLVFRTGEVESIGILSAIALVLGLWGMGAINVSALGVALLVLGIAFIVLEVFFTPPDFGILGLGGTIAFLLGITVFAQEPLLASPFTQTTFWLILGAGLAMAAFFVMLGKWSFKTFRLKPKVGSEALIGQTAIVIEPLAPLGRIKINRENWRAQNINEKEIIEAGEKVEIIKAQGNTLMVKRSKSPAKIFEKN